MHSPTLSSSLYCTWFGLVWAGIHKAPSPTGAAGVVWWCPCIQYGLNANRLESMRDYRTCISRDPVGGAVGGGGGR